MSWRKIFRCRSFFVEGMADTDFFKGYFVRYIDEIYCK